eukprot:3155797-Rhodomonas_salina.4
MLHSGLGSDSDLVQIPIACTGPTPSPDPEHSQYPPTLENVPVRQFPLFLTQGEWLRMLDGTLADPFWARNSDGSLVHASEVVFHEEIGTLDALPEEVTWLSDDSEEEEEEEEEAGGGG